MFFQGSKLRIAINFSTADLKIQLNTLDGS